MEEKGNTLGFQEQPKVEVDSPPLSPRSSDDDDETEPDYSDGEEEEGGAGIGTGAAVVSGPPLKKGPWTPDEDKRLRTYVEAHGEGNWNHVQRNAGLNRCGKSCRLRWANHLRPHLKKGPFSPEEEDKIIELHATHGNKWAKMASQLPGRTDNEIKNFWNTRSKRRKKFGLSLYPDGLLSRVKTNQDMDSHSPDNSHGKKRPNELLQGNGLQFDDIVFEKLDYKKRAENFLAPPFTIPDSLPLEAVNPLKRHASSDMVSGYGVSPTCERFPHEPDKTCYADIYPGIIKYHSVPFTNAIANGPPILDGNFSTSGTIQRPMKVELPSLQYTGYESINSCSYHIPPATLEHADTFIPSPASVLLKTDYFPSQNNGLLDAMVLQGHVGAYEVLVPPVYPLSPHSSVFDDNLLEGSPLDKFRTLKSPAPASLDALLADSKHQADAIFADKCLSPLPYSCRFGASAEANFLNEDSPHSEYQPINEPLNAMLYGDSCDEVMLSAQGDGHQHTFESVTWNSMPGARHEPGS